MLPLQQHQLQRPARPGTAAAAPPLPLRRRRDAPARPRRRRRAPLAAPPSAAAGADESFGDAVKRVARRVQGALPVIGLLSRLTSPEGGFDGAGAVTYAEFSRGVYNSGDAYASFSAAADELEKAHGRPASSRYLLLGLWMADQGAGGLVAPRDVVAAMRRLRVTGDMEIEIDRFLGARDATLAKYAMVERAPASDAARAELGADAVAAVALGLKDGQPLAGDDARRVAGVVAAALKAPMEVAEAAVAARAERSLAQQQQQAAAAGPK
jgi:1,3-beta-glucan synthase